MERSIQVNELELDVEWWNLLLEAKNLGLTVEEIRSFFTKQEKLDKDKNNA